MSRTVHRLVFAAALTPLLLTGVVFAELVTVVQSSSRFSKHLLFVCDVSGSMYGRPFSKALTTFKALASQPTDELEIGLIAFADKPVRWLPAKKTTWAKLPNAKAVKKAGSWLKTQGPGGGTKVIPALKLALADKKKKLTVVLVTDGIFNETDATVLKAVETAQKDREKNKLGRALIAILGVGSKQKVLTQLGKTGKGGYYRTQ